MELNFSKKVKETFVFLIEQYDFVCVEEGPYSVRYESSKVYVSIDFEGFRSYELEVNFGFLSDSEQTSYSLGELLRCMGSVSKETHRVFQVTKEELLEKYLKIFARNLAKHGKSVLVGDKEIFRHLREQRDEECKKYSVDLEISQMRSSLQTAWDNRDYQQVVELLEPFSDNLSDAEKKKLHYAKTILL